MESSAENPNVNEDPRRMMAVGVFKWNGGVRYNGTKDRPNPKPHIYPREVETFFIIGEEEQAWEKVKREAHHPNRYIKEVIMENKRIENIREMGYSMVLKDGTIRQPGHNLTPKSE